MTNEIFSTILQILLFTLIPFLVYLISKRSVKEFFIYIGFKPTTHKAYSLGFLLSLLLALPILALTLVNPEYKAIMIDPGSISGAIRNTGFSGEAIATILIVAIFKTSLAEEILFRGFIAKRLINITNFQIGNIIQAVLFGILHVFIFVSISKSILLLTLIFLFPAAFAYFIVYLNEKVGDGSIIPGWIAHGSANFISYNVVAFLI